MRVIPLLLLLLIIPSSFSAQAEKRHGIAADAKTYPQATAKEALASVLVAIENGQVPADQGLKVLWDRAANMMSEALQGGVRTMASSGG